MKPASMKLGLLTCFVAALCVATCSPNSWAVVVPFMEDFTNNNAGWANFNSSGFLTHNPSGGPDGGAYASGPRTLNGLTVGNTSIALRARHDDPWNSSGDAFAGNWIDGGARQIRAWVRHDIPVAVNFFARVAGTANFPGHVYVDGIAADSNTWKLVQPNTWTPLFFDVSKFSPQLLSPEGGTWDGVFSNVGHVQFGVFVPSGFASDTTMYTIGIDKVSIATPEPASACMAAVAVLGVTFFSRRCRNGNGAK